MKKRSMKRLAGSLGLVGASIVAGAIQADAQNRSGQIQLTGSNALSCTLAIVAGGSYNSLSLGTTQSDTPVGTSTETCNDLKGYYVTVASTNAGAGGTSPYFKGSNAQNSVTLAYAVNYGSNTALTFAGGSATASTYNAYSASNAAGNTVTVGVSYTGTPSLPADTYTDTLTFTMTVN
jgi:hypothetical protein